MKNVSRSQCLNVNLCERFQSCAGSMTPNSDDRVRKDERLRKSTRRFGSPLTWKAETSCKKRRVENALLAANELTLLPLLFTSVMQDAIYLEWKMKMSTINVEETPPRCCVRFFLKFRQTLTKQICSHRIRMVRRDDHFSIFFCGCSGSAFGSKKSTKKVASNVKNVQKERHAFFDWKILIKFNTQKYPSICIHVPFRYFYWNI